MGSAPNPTPTLEEFLNEGRRALAFLKDFGFEEIPAPVHRASNPFQLWFCAVDRFVVVSGESYGTSASIHLEHRSGVRTSEIELVPPESRPRQSKRGVRTSQLQQIDEAAQRLRTFSEDFLEGRIDRFLRVAKPLPPYLRKG